MSIIFRDDIHQGTLTVFRNTANNTYEAKVPIKFDASQWRLENFGIVVDANQSFNPFINPDVPRLLVTSTYGGRLASVKLEWNVFDWNSGKSGTDLEQFSTGGPSGRDMIVKAEYSTGVIFTQEDTVSCSFAITVQLMFVSIVTNPTSEPGDLSHTVTKDGNSPPEPFKWPWETWDTTTKILAGAFAVTALVLIVRPSAPATIISSGYRAYRGRNS